MKKIVCIENYVAKIFLSYMLLQMLKRKKIETNEKLDVITENNVNKLMFRKLIAAKRLKLHNNCILQTTKYYK